MKSRFLMCFAAISLFVVVAIPAHFAAQEKPDQGHHHHYKLIDLGTFGGPTGWLCNFPNGGGSACPILNNRGVVVSGADTSSPNPNYLNSNPFLPPYQAPVGDPFIQHAFQWLGGALQDLGTLPGGYNSAAQGVSANGLVVGLSENGGIDPFFGVPEVHAVLWQNNGHSITDLGTLEGGYESMAFSVNDRAQVVGFAVNTIPDPFIFGEQVRAFLWQNGAMQDLGTLDTGTDAQAYWVNESGQVAGVSFTNTTVNEFTGFPTQDPFLWEKGTMTDLGTLGGNFGLPNGFNNRGQAAGTSNLAGDVNAHAFFWTSPGPMQDLGTLGGSSSNANWINEAGAIVGGSWTSNDQGFHAFLWKGGPMIDLGPPDACTEALSINSKNQVVGFACGNTAAILWDHGQAIDLNIFNHSGSGLQQLDLAYNINDRGEIDGLGVPPGCGDPFACGHVFALIPCDEHHGDGDCKDGSESVRAIPRVSPLSRDVVRGKQRLYPPSRTNRFRIPGFAIGNRAANDPLDSATLSTPTESGFCGVNINDTLTGLCIGGGITSQCTDQYDKRQCPPGKKAIAPTNFACGYKEVVRVDGARHCPLCGGRCSLGCGPGCACGKDGMCHRANESLKELLWNPQP